MKRMKQVLLLAVLFIFVMASCRDQMVGSTLDFPDCTSDIEIDRSRGACSETLAWDSEVSLTQHGSEILITANGIPNHRVGVFGRVPGAINPNAISEQSERYTLTMSPQETGSLIPLLGDNGPEYSFGVLLNGVEVDPVAAEPFPHEGMFAQNVNWGWNLEALNVRIGLDCNNAHVQPTGKYHYHGAPTLFLEDLNIETNEMRLIGYAADGFPLYYKYAYVDATNAASEVIAMSSSWQLKSGNRPGDGVTAPCGVYDGVYTQDYEYVEGLGDLDEANGRFGVTPEYPEGTYYYVLTDEFPAVPRYFKGQPSLDFKLGRP